MKYLIFEKNMDGQQVATARIGLSAWVTVNLEKVDII